MALIPARSGSKSIKNKNLQLIAGRSLLEITIGLAQDTSLIQEVYVSSDSDEILEVGESLGCLSVHRTYVAATDSATANDVVRDFVTQLNLSANQENLIIYMQPTSPFREKEMIERGIQLATERSKSVVAVTEVQHHPQKTLIINEREELQFYLDNSDPTANRQSLPKVMIATGSLYIFSVADFSAHNSIPIRGAIPLPVSGIYALDIDNDLDLEIAQKIGN